MLDQQKYEKEAKKRFGHTEAYKESQKKTASYSKEKWNDILCGMNGIFQEFAACQKEGSAPQSKPAQKLVQKLQDYITENFYHCTDDILAGLGQMYVCDERFKNNINSHGEGAAEFVSKAIGVYCGK